MNSINSSFVCHKLLKLGRNTAHMGCSLCGPNINRIKSKVLVLLMLSMSDDSPNILFPIHFCQYTRQFAV